LGGSRLKSDGYSLVENNVLKLILDRTTYAFLGGRNHGRLTDPACAKRYRLIADEQEHK
jgi:hypothetical protein